MALAKRLDVTSHEARSRFMLLAVEEARRGLGRTSPNPAVGALVVCEGEVVGRGFHARAGDPHAEVVALRDAGARARGAELYTTLEPCDHEGRTPPCTRAILTAGIARVFVGSADPNPLVSGRGVRRLRASGVEVVQGVAREVCDGLNLEWFHFITTGRPHVTLKAAITADGKLAAGSGDSHWITGPAARKRVHRVRSEVDAVMVGANTVLLDDPRLTARIPGGNSPLRIVLDGRLRTRPSARVYRGGAPGALLITSTRSAARASVFPRGVELLELPAKGGRIELAAMLAGLAGRGIVRLLVEGGAGVFGQFLEKALWDRLLLFVAPKVLGDRALPWVQMPRGERLGDAMSLGAFEVEAVGGDALLRVERRH